MVKCKMRTRLESTGWGSADLRVTCDCGGLNDKVAPRSGDERAVFERHLWEKRHLHS